MNIHVNVIFIRRNCSCIHFSFIFRIMKSTKYPTRSHANKNWWLFAAVGVFSKSSARQLARVIPKLSLDNGRPENGIRIRDSGTGHRETFLFSQFFAIVHSPAPDDLFTAFRGPSDAAENAGFLSFFFLAHRRGSAIKIGVYLARNVRVLRFTFYCREWILGE